MITEKKSPPDLPGNIVGRMRQLLVVTDQNLRVNGVPADKLDEAIKKASEAKMKKLRTRLKKVAHLAKPVNRDAKKSLRHTKVTKATKKATKKATRTVRKKAVSDDPELDDIFELLNNS